MGLFKTHKLRIWPPSMRTNFLPKAERGTVPRIGVYRRPHFLRHTSRARTRGHTSTHNLARCCCKTQGRGPASQGRTLENGDHVPPERASSGVLFRDSPPRLLSRLHDDSRVRLKAELKIPATIPLWQNVIIKMSAYKKPVPLVCKIKLLRLKDPI